MSIHQLTVNVVTVPPLPSNRNHLSCGDFLEEEDSNC